MKSEVRKTWGDSVKEFRDDDADCLVGINVARLHKVTQLFGKFRVKPDLEVPVFTTLILVALP